MSDSVMQQTDPDHKKIANKALNGAAKFWFLTAFIGQGLFVFYIINFYWLSAAQGNFEKWSNVLPEGIIPGDTAGNMALAAHVLLAAIITFAGLLQLIPQIRSRNLNFHRWNGRVFMITALIMSLSGLYMVFTRGVAGGDGSSISLNAVLIMLSAGMAYRYVRGGDIDNHRKWALRLFLLVNGVWFFRLGLMLWLMIHKGPVGFDPATFTGPFLTFLGFSQFLIPLVVLELYFRAQKSSVVGKYSMAIGLSALTLLMAAGIFAAFMGLWLPRI